ncbi:hypothetical protein BHE74_00011456 [Ensete ventricosum]|nr:hypothetical protein BHE74_00011456 [Ensete ventricosum]
MRTGGARLVFWFARRSVRSKFIEDAPIPSVRSTFPFVSWSCCYVTRFRRSHLFVASLQMEDSSRLSIDREEREADARRQIVEPCTWQHHRIVEVGLLWSHRSLALMVGERMAVEGVEEVENT